MIDLEYVKKNGGYMLDDFCFQEYTSDKKLIHIITIENKIEYKKYGVLDEIFLLFDALKSEFIITDFLSMGDGDIIKFRITNDLRLDIGRGYNIEIPKGLNIKNIALLALSEMDK